MTWLNVSVSSWDGILSLSMSWPGTTAAATRRLVWGGRSLPNRGTLLAPQPPTSPRQQSQTCAVCSAHQVLLSPGEDGLTVDATVKSLRWCSVCINMHLQAARVELPQLSKHRWHRIALERMSPLVFLCLRCSKFSVFKDKCEMSLECKSHHGLLLHLLWLPRAMGAEWPRTPFLWIPISTFLLCCHHWVRV